MFALVAEKGGWLLLPMFARLSHCLLQRVEVISQFVFWSKTPMEFAEEIVSEADQYNGFNLLIADLSSMDMIYVTNRPKQNNCYVTAVSPGIHVLSNASLDTPWPKSQRLEHSFKNLLDVHCEGEIPIKEMVDRLMCNTVKDDVSRLPHIYAPEFEYQLSSIFVETETPKGRYGTRSTSALAVKVSGEVFYHERHLENDSWKEQTATYKVEKEMRK